MNKMLKFLKFRTSSKQVTPRLKFGARLSESAYADDNMHPALEALLYYLYTSGCIPTRDTNCIELTQEEFYLAKVMIKHLSNGTFRNLNPTVHTSTIIISVIRYYLKKLPKHLFYGIKTREWGLLCDMLPNSTDSPDEQAKQHEYCKSRAENLFTTVKPSRRNFSHVLMITLHRMAARSSCPNAVVVQLAQYLAPILMHEKKDKLVDFRVRGDLVTCMKFLIHHAPDIFNFRSMILPPVFLASDHCKSTANAETADEATVVLDN